MIRERLDGGSCVRKVGNKVGLAKQNKPNLRYATTCTYLAKKIDKRDDGLDLLQAEGGGRRGSDVKLAEFRALECDACLQDGTTKEGRLNKNWRVSILHPRTPTHKHTQRHPRTNTHKHTHPPTHPPTHPHTHTHTPTHPHPPKHSHTNTRKPRDEVGKKPTICHLLSTRGSSSM
jgi:hypothetical protein